MEALSAAEQIEEFLARPAAGGGAASAKLGHLAHPPAIELRSVDFSYGGTQVLSGLSLRIGSGEHVAITGASGAGKSTLLSLLNLFAHAQKGEILIDGMPLATVDAAEWRRVVAWLPQRPTLFHGSVRENVRLGRPDASEDDIRKALALARAEDIRPDTPVGEAGQGISTGQAQRIALARLFLRAPRVVLLDEPTAHLDAGTAALVSEGIKELSARCTTLLVTHRAESAAGVDRAVEIRNGKAVSAP
jgi:ATP-binding cassette, subfamily C, bacterial CydD